MDTFDIDIDALGINVDWPIIARFKDDLFPYHGYDHIRYTARAIIENEEGKFGFLHLVGEDFFGVRDHLETCGGGMEKGEDLVDTILREIGEEMGVAVKECDLLGSIIDAYNLIYRITFSTFFYCKVDTKHVEQTHRTEEETILIKDIVWLTQEEALKRLNDQNGSNVDRIVQRRDAAAFEYYLKKKGSTD